MNSWEVTIVTESNYLKKVRVDNCITREDAEAAALGMSGARRVLNSVPKTYYDESYSDSVSEPEQQVTYNSFYIDDEDDYVELDEMELEMYNIMCEIALEEGREIPSIEEFENYLNG